MRLSLNEEDMTNSDRVASALKATKKGQLKYDTKWIEEGRTEVRQVLRFSRHLT